MRFHSKHHQKSHHSLPSAGYPDSALDPIASQSEPFIGNFWLDGILFADTISVSAPISSFEVDTLVVNNQISTLDVGTLDVTSFGANTDGSNLINVDADTLNGLNSSNFELVSNKDQPDGYVGFVSGNNVNTIDNIFGLSSLNGIAVFQYLNEFNLSSTVAPLISSGNSFGFELPDELLPEDITGLSSINSVDIDDYVKWVTPPTLSSDSGSVGDAAYDSDFIYVCIATDQWKRATLTGW